MNASGDHVVFTTGSFAISKVVSCLVPCCATCLKRKQIISILIFAVPVVPWLLFLILSQTKLFAGLMSSNMNYLLIALSVPLGISVILFWYKTLFLTKAVRLYLQGSNIAGVVINNKPYAEDAATLNSIQLQRVSFMKGW